MNVIIPGDILKLRNNKFHAVMVNAALNWLHENPDKNPEYSMAGALIFNDDADEIGDIVVKAGEEKDLYVEPYMTANAVLDAKNIIQHGFLTWLSSSRTTTTK